VSEPLLRSSRSPLDKGGVLDFVYALALLIDAERLHPHDSPLGTRGGGTHLDDFAGESNRVASINRPKPFQILEARRRADFGRTLTARDHLGGEALVIVDDQTHAGGGRMPARGAQPAEMRAFCGFFVNMKGLRIETTRKALDVFGGKGVLAEFAHVADAYIVKEFHSAATLLFFPNIPG